MEIYRFQHNEMVGIILTFMTHEFVFHWYEDHFPSQDLNG